MQTKLKEIIFKYSDLICIIFIVIICLIFFFPYIFSSPTPLIFPVSDLGTDLDRDVLPNIEYIVTTIKSTGEIPLWRYYSLSGSPLVGHPSLPIFYPLYWLLLFIPINFGINLIALINITWMGIGMYLFLRIPGGNKPFPSMAGAIAFALSPKWIAHLSGGHWLMLSSLSWTPWSFFLFERFWKTRKIYWLIFLSISLSSIGINHLPIFFITSITLAFISISYFDRSNFRYWIKTMLYGWGCVISLTFILSAGQFLPLIELLPHTIHTSDNSLFTSLHPFALFTSIFPPILKYPEWFLFPGLVVLFFVLLSSKEKFRRFEKTWLVIGIIGLVMSLGEFTPIYSILFGWNPLISVLRVPTRWWLLTLIVLVVLFTSGFNNWIENKYHINQKQIIIISIILLIEIIAGIMRISLGRLFPFDTVYTGLLAIILSIVIIIGYVKPSNLLPVSILFLLIIEIFIIWNLLIKTQQLNYSDTLQGIISEVESKIQDFERIYSPEKGIPVIYLIQSKIHSADGYDALPMENYMKFIRMATGCPLVQEAIGPQEEIEACLNPNKMKFDWLRLINVRYLVVQNDSQWDITELSPGLGRIFSVENVKKTTDNQCLNDLEMIDIESIALIEGEIFETQQGSFEILDNKKSVNKEVFTVRVNNAPTLLIRSENWAPGWKVKVNGQTANNYRVNCILQGVWLEEGNQTVEFTYQPFGYPIGFWISSLSLMGLIFLTLIVLLRKAFNSQ